MTIPIPPEYSALCTAEIGDLLCCMPPDHDGPHRDGEARWDGTGLIADASGTLLQGAGDEPAPFVRVATAAEFAAVWNAATPDRREEIVSRLMQSQDDAQTCFIQDHQGEIDALRRRPITDAQVRAAAKAMYAITNLLSMSGAGDLARAALEAARDA